MVRGSSLSWSQEWKGSSIEVLLPTLGYRFISCGPPNARYTHCWLILINVMIMWCDFFLGVQSVPLDLSTKQRPVSPIPRPIRQGAHTSNDRCCGAFFNPDANGFQFPVPNWQFAHHQQLSCNSMPSNTIIQLPMYNNMYNNADVPHPMYTPFNM